MAARQIKDFTFYKAVRWLYEQIESWSSHVHMLRKTVMQMAYAGEDANLAVARDISVTKGVMLAHSVSEEDAEMKTEADRMYRRIYDGLTAEVAHRASGTEDLERQLRDAVSEKDGDRTKRLSSRLAKQDRHAG